MRTKSIEEVAEFVCENLPEGWEISIDFDFECLSVRLFDEFGDIACDSLSDDELNVWQMVVQRVNFAREKDGLGKVDVDCKHGFDLFEWCEKCDRR